MSETTGWELDVTVSEVTAAYYNPTVPVEACYSQFVIDFCRSRIRPVMECKECADNKRLTDAAIISERVATDRINATRAALEGE